MVCSRSHRKKPIAFKVNLCKRRNLIERMF